jgi:hypothetical protein
MSREDTLLCVLALGPATRADLVVATGWGIEPTNQVIDAMLAAGRLAFFPQAGNNRHRHSRQLLCLPAQRSHAVLTTPNRRALQP